MDEQNTIAGLTDSAEESIELPDDFDLFGSEGDTNQQADQDKVTEDGEQSAETEPAEQKQTYEVTFNGQKMQLTMDELISNAQKGLNYDHVKEKAGRADANQKAADIIAGFAEAAGVTVEEYLSQAEEQLSGRALRELTDRGMDEDLAQELLTLRAQQASNTRESQAKADQQRRVNAWNALADHLGGWENVPFKTAEQVPAEMQKHLDAGRDPLTAYLLYKESENSKQLAAAQLAAKNRQRAPGSVKGTTATAKGDPFLDGFLS